MKHKLAFSLSTSLWFALRTNLFFSLLIFHFVANNNVMENKVSGAQDGLTKTYVKWKISTQQKDIDFLRRENNRLRQKLTEALEKKRESSREK